MQRGQPLPFAESSRSLVPQREQRESGMFPAAEPTQGPFEESSSSVRRNLRRPPR